MASVGVRELRQRASDLLRRVQRGETIEITDRGRPIAMLTPVPVGGELERLRAAGDVDTATSDPANLPALVELPPDIESPSTVLARLRRNER